MTRFAVIENNEVTNVILAEPGFTLEGVMLVEVGDESMVSPGWTYQDGVLVAPPEPEPELEPAPETELDTFPRIGATTL
jgi:hypothetical protein